MGRGSSAAWYFRVVQLPDGSWSCRHGLRIFDCHHSLDDALAHITEIAAAHQPAEVFVHSHDGFIQRIKVTASGKN